MNTTEFRAAVQEALRANFLARLEDYLMKVDVDGSIEDKRKAVELTSKLADALPEKDASRSYPVVHINFAGGVSATVTQAQQLETVEEVDPLQTTPELQKHLAVNLDVEPLLFEAA